MSLADRYREWVSAPHIAPVAIDDWELVPYPSAGEPVAIAALQGTEIHFVSSPAVRGRLLTSRRISSFLEPLMDRKGFLTTRVMRGAPGEHAQISFVERIGFEATGIDAYFHHFMLSELRLARHKEH